MQCKTEEYSHICGNVVTLLEIRKPKSWHDWHVYMNSFFVDETGRGGELYIRWHCHLPGAIQCCLSYLYVTCLCILCTCIHAYLYVTCAYLYVTCAYFYSNLWHSCILPACVYCLVTLTLAQRSVAALPESLCYSGHCVCGESWDRCCSLFTCDKKVSSI